MFCIRRCINLNNFNQSRTKLGLLNAGSIQPWVPYYENLLVTDLYTYESGRLCIWRFDHR